MAYVPVVKKCEKTKDTMGTKAIKKLGFLKTRVFQRTHVSPV